jgi:hypothetical protein
MKIRRDFPWGLWGGGGGGQLFKIKLQKKFIYLNLLSTKSFLLKKRRGKKQKSLQGRATHNSLRLCTTGDDRLTQGQNINIHFKLFK